MTLPGGDLDDGLAPPGWLAADDGSRDQRVPAGLQRKPAETPAPLPARGENLTCSIALPIEFLVKEAWNVKTLARRSHGLEVKRD